MKHYPDRCESLEVDIGEMEYSDADIRYIALNTGGEQQQRLCHTPSQQGTSDLPVATVGRWYEHSRMLVIHEPKCQELSQVVKHLSEKQEKLIGAEDELVKIRTEKSQAKDLSNHEIGAQKEK